MTEATARKIATHVNKHRSMGGKLAYTRDGEGGAWYDNSSRLPADVIVLHAPVFVTDRWTVAKVLARFESAS